MHTILIYIHLIVSHDSFQRQAVQHKKYFECFHVQQSYQLLLQMFPTQQRSTPPQTNKQSKQKQTYSCVTNKTHSSRTVTLCQ